MRNVLQDQQLEGLHDIALPEPVSWMPQTIGWYVAGAVIVGLVVWAAVGYYQRRRTNRYRRAALAELADIETTLADPAKQAAALGAIPVLVKRVALSFTPRDAIASLTGDPWLRWLDASYAGTEFSHGVGRLLPQMAYRPRPTDVSQDEITDLVALVRQWIQQHDPALSTDHCSLITDH